jgi:RNA-directed DNA polymerase
LTARIGSVTDTEGKMLINKILPATTELSEKLPTKTNLLVSTHLVRFADDFLFITLNPEGIENSQRAIDKFLKERGLSLSEEKTRTIKFSLGQKLDFLG